MMEKLSLLVLIIVCFILLFENHTKQSIVDVKIFKEIRVTKLKIQHKLQRQKLD